jgi:hypothetical protein
MCVVVVVVVVVVYLVVVVVVYLVIKLHGMSHKGGPPKRKPKQGMDPGATTRNSRHDRSGKTRAMDH